MLRIGVVAAVIGWSAAIVIVAALAVALSRASDWIENVTPRRWKGRR